MNVANQITLARILLVPVVMFFLLAGLDFGSIRFSGYEITYTQLLAALIFMIAAATDGLDGYLARKNNMVTNLGKLLDPLADKLLVAAALICLVDMGKLSALIAIIIISREFAVTGLRQVALLDGKVLAAGIWGKWKTAIQIAMIAVMLLNNFPAVFFDFPLDVILSWAAALITLWSGIDYFIQNRRLIPVE